MCRPLMKVIRMNSFGGTKVDEGYGSIYTTVQMVWTGRAYERRCVDWRWDGPPLAWVSYNLTRLLVGKRALQPADEIRIGPYRVSVVRYDMVGDQYLVRRVDQQALAGWLMMWRLWLQQGLVDLGQKLVLTLALWGLAEWPKGGARPTLDLVKRRWRRAP